MPAEIRAAKGVVNGIDPSELIEAAIDAHANTTGRRWNSAALICSVPSTEPQFAALYCAAFLVASSVGWDKKSLRL